MTIGSLPFTKPAVPNFLLDDVGESSLSAERRQQIRDFRRDGFVVVQGSGLLDEIDTAGVWRGLEPNTVDVSSGRVQDGWRSNAAVRSIATSLPVLQLLRELYGRDPIPFQTLNFWNGTEQSTHTDTIHFSCFPERFMCGVWVALEDITLRQGPLHYYPGSHKIDEVDFEDLGVAPIRGALDKNADVTRAYQEYLDVLYGKLEDFGSPYKELSIKKGDFLVWSSNLLHGGSRRVDEMLSRKSQVTHYYFEGVLPFTPMFSRRSRREFFVRTIEDIRTGVAVKNTINGRALAYERADDQRMLVGFADEMYDPEQALRYLARYRDVKEVCKTPEAAYTHYLDHGFSERRHYFDRPRNDWLNLRDRQ